ncbi:MAG: transcription antitermination factor NusB [Ruminococcaceae bacterium]|nr:transcription antitermination factor NusB [Oscillospiraceae bacterium]
MGRRETRDATVKFIFSDDFSQVRKDMETLEERIDNFFRDYDGCEKKDIDMVYVKKVVDGTIEHSEEIDKLIKEHTENWSPERMAKIDMAILRVAVYEMLYMEDVPESVSINEAIELAKKYSHEDAGTFVNGILGGIYRSNK